MAAEATGTVQYKSDAFALSATTDTITVSGSVLRENVNITHSFISVKVTLVDDSTQTKYVRHNFVDAENVWENHTQVLTYSQQIKAIVFVSLRVKESGGRLHYDDLSVIEN